MGSGAIVLHRSDWQPRRSLCWSWANLSQAGQPVRAEAVRTIGALCAVPNEQDDPPDYRYQEQQYPPAAAIEIVKTTNGHRQCWQECSQIEDRLITLSVPIPLSIM
jgi:hypothetical protein